MVRGDRLPERFVGWCGTPHHRSEEVPRHVRTLCHAAVPEQPDRLGRRGSAGPATPKTLLEQMQELLASVTADLAALQSDTRDTAPSAAYPAGTDTSAAPTAPGAR